MATPKQLKLWRFYPKISCQGRSKPDNTGFKWTLNQPFGTKRSQVQILSPRPSVPTLGTASELVRYDRLTFLYANPGPMPPFSPVFRRITRLGLQQEPGLFVNFGDQPYRDFVSGCFPRIYRVPRVIRVFRIIRVIIGLYCTP